MSAYSVTLENITLVRGNALDVIPRLGPFDGCFADPPYCSGGSARAVSSPSEKKYCQTGYAGQKLPTFHGDHMDQRAFTRFGQMWAQAVCDASNDGAILGSFTDWRQLGVTQDFLQIGGWIMRGVYQWEKPAPRPQRGRFSAAAEYLVWGSKGALPFNRGPALLGRYQARAPKERVHVTQKPVDLYAELFRIVPEGGRILDPFLGSGSSAVAAVQSGHPFVGIEMSEHFFDVAVARVRQALSDRAGGGGG